MSERSAPRVSVVIPAFNRAATIQAAIQSVLDQVCGDPFDLLVVDDGSTDATVEKIRELDDPRIQLILHSENRGGGAARNTGVEASQADWIAFHDSDDVWLPGKLARQLDLTVDPRVVAVYCGMRVEAYKGHRPRYHPDPSILPRDGEIQRQLLRQSFVSTQTLLVRRSVLHQAGGFDVRMPALEDWDLAIRLAGLGRFALVDEPLVLQRFSENSITHSRERRLRAQVRILEKHAELIALEPALAAFHHHRISGEARRLGHWALAQAHAREARRFAPFSPRYWANEAFVALGGSFRASRPM